jgi:hypothetical protein
MDTDTLMNPELAVAPEQAAAPVEPVTPEPTAPVTPEAPEDPALAAINSLTSKVDEFLAGNQEPSPEPVDLLDAIESTGSEDSTAPVEPQGQPAADPNAERELEQFTQFVDSRAQEILTPFLQEQRETQVRALSEKYPDMKQPEIRDLLIEKVREIARRSGNEALLSDPVAIEMAYLSVKAQQADAGAVPAEQAGDNGASLETHAGNSQAGVPSDRDDYISKVFPGITL